MQTSISTFNHTLEKSNGWLKELAQIGKFESEENAYAALRSVLHSLRNRLTVDGAAHLAAQLPTLIRGIYYEGWKPSITPKKIHTKDEFLENIENELRNATNRIDSELAAKAVFKLLSEKISDGEISDIKSELPNKLLSLWP